MIPKRLRNNNRFFLKVRNRGSWLKRAGRTDTGEGPGRPAAETTRHLSEAQGFKTMRQAKRMRSLLEEQYGLKTDIIRYEGSNRYEY